MNRKEHLDWCKERALEYISDGDHDQAWPSMMSDLSKHKETRDHSAIELGMMLLLGGHLSTPEEIKKFILGLN